MGRGALFQANAGGRRVLRQLLANRIPAAAVEAQSHHSISTTDASNGDARSLLLPRGFLSCLTSSGGATTLTNQQIISSLPMPLILSTGFHSSTRLALGVPQESEPEMEMEAEQRSLPTDRVQRLVDEIANLSLLEVADLTSLLKKKLGLPDMPMGGMMMPMGGMPGGMPLAAGGAAGAGGGVEAEAKVEKTAFDVKLQKFDAASKLKIIKEVRAITGLGLKESKELVESAPSVLKAGASKEEAEAMAEKLKALGADIVLE